MDPDDNNHPATPISSIGHPETTSFPSPPSFVLPLSVAPPSPKSPPFSPFLGFDCFESELQPNPELRGGGSLSDVPQPLGTLYETPIPPFLSKTYDLVDDPSLDAIISWGAKGESFVVWDPVEFARMILPRNFKHNNFSSFVRQLNTYGFRKIDTDKWEFANERFRKGQRHILKNIQRRKSHNSQPIVTLSGSPHDLNTVSLEAEIERLRRERSSMMQEVVELQHQQRGTIQHMGIVNEKLQTAEKRQKQMVSFLGKIFHNPVFLARLQQKKEQKTITSPRAIRKFLKHQPQEMGTSGLEPKGQILRYPLLEMVDSAILGTKDVPFQVEDDREMMSGSLGTSEQAGPDPAHGTLDILLNGNDVVGPQARSVPDCFIPFPEDLGNKKNFPESKIPESESSMATEDGIWSMGFETGIHMSSSTNDLWGNVNGYNLQELGYLSGIWELDAVQLAGSSGVERWPDEDSPFNKFENKESQPRNDSP